MELFGRSVHSLRWP